MHLDTRFIKSPGSSGRFLVRVDAIDLELIRRDGAWLQKLIDLLPVSSEVYKFFATTAKGMEALLADELRSLGAQQLQQARAGVHFEGSLEVAYRACLWSRVANRVLLPLKTFLAPDPGKLYGGVKSIRWTDHMSADETLAVDFSSSRSAITHTHFGALKVKDAIVDQFRSVTGARPSVSVFQPDIRVNVYLHENEATVSLDLSGESLHLRGYREDGARAPLKENLAAAILLLADWPKAASEGAALMDPMCGSGTLLIEAALMAAHRAPGLGRRHYGFIGWKKHDPSLWERLLAEARAKEITDPKRLPRIVGYDSDFRAVRAALANVERAGLRGRVHVEKRDVSLLEPVQDRGILVVNPPYGERLGEIEELKPLHKSLGDLLKKRFAGWNAFVLTGNPELAQAIGLKPSRRHVLFNGAIECRLLKYELFAGREKERKLKS